LYNLFSKEISDARHNINTASGGPSTGWIGAVSPVVQIYKVFCNRTSIRKIHVLGVILVLRVLINVCSIVNHARVTCSQTHFMAVRVVCS
jgi:hypothetical protein